LVVHQTRALTWSTAPFMLWCIQQLFEISCCNSMGISSIIDIIAIFWYFLLATSFPRRNKFWTQKYNGNCDFFPPFQISGPTFNSISIILVQHHGGTPQNSCSDIGPSSYCHWKILETHSSKFYTKRYHRSATTGASPCKVLPRGHHQRSILRTFPKPKVTSDQVVTTCLDWHVVFTKE
jgi:hypothetical protein